MDITPVLEAVLLNSFSELFGASGRLAVMYKITINENEFFL